MNEVAKIEEQKGEVVSASDAMISMIERVATNPDADVDKMERLIKMKLDLMDRDAEQAFNEAMKAAQAKMPAIYRNAANSQTHSRYAKLEAIAEKAAPIYTAHGFSLSFGTADSPIAQHYRITCTVSHDAGHKREYFADVPADLTGMKGNQNKTATHAFGSTMSYGRRYLTMLIFNIVLTDEDDDGQAAGAGDIITEDQEAILSAKIAEVGADKARFLKAYSIETLADLPAAKFSDAMNKLAQKAAQK
jgi:hypothetical protein